MARKKPPNERIEPTFDVMDDDEAPRAAPQKRAAPEHDEARKKSAAKSRGQKPAKSRRRRSILGLLVYWIIVLGVWGVVALGGVFAYYAAQLPPIDHLAIPKRPPNIAVLAADGTLLANRGDTGGPAVRLADLPPFLPKAFVAIEDRRFYSHWGVDPVGILRALVNNALGRGTMQGGSTLTQQLAKNLFLTQERTVSRKMQEAVLALWLEHKFTKNQILELYLNRVYFGSGAYGVDAAAQKYFGHPAAQVSIPEAAMLGGLMKAPTKLAPNHNEQAAIERANQVVVAMRDAGYISAAQAKDALDHPAHAARGRDSSATNYVADYVMDSLDDTIGAIDQDIVVTSTVDPLAQTAAERALVEVLAAKGAKYGASQGAVVALDMNGAIKALVGGRDYEDSQFDRVVAAHRQPGSSFKPFVYLTALEHGMTPDTTVEDAPIDVRGWRPENSTHRYLGPVPLTTALAMSLNTVAVRLGLEVGPRAIIDTARRLGINSPLQPNASIALGTSEVTPLELAAAYVPFANGGVSVQPHIIAKVRTAAGKLIYARRGSSNGRAIDPLYVGMMNAMLQQTLIIGTARAASLPGWQAAGKTGTSQDYRDAWFVGYTGALVTGVWIGNDDNSPTKKASGANLPVEIWSKTMREALRAVKPVGLPTGGYNPGGFGAPGGFWPFGQGGQQAPQGGQQAPQDGQQVVQPGGQGAPQAGGQPQPAPTQPGQPQYVPPPPPVASVPDEANGPDEAPVPPENIPHPAARRPQQGPPDLGGVLQNIFGGFGR